MKLDRTTARRSAFIAAIASALVLTACSTPGSGTSSNPAVTPGIKKLSIIVPADPGGGWDQTGRALQRALQQSNLISGASVQNVGGAGGTNGLAKLATETNPDTLMVMGYVMVGAVETNKAVNRLETTTPIARLTEEAEVIVVPAGSPYKTIDDLIADIRTRGKAVAVTGGSAGGVDHILAGMILKEAGIGVDHLNYIPYSGGGQSLAALLGNKVAAGISGVGEYAEQVKAGKLRALAVSGSSPAQQLPDVRTLKDQGINVVLTNWRGVVAPGSIDKAQAERLTKLITALHATAHWKESLASNNWGDAFLAGDEFAAFLNQDIKNVGVTLRSIGLLS